MKKLLVMSLLAFLSINCSGTRPTNLGVVNGKLAPCPNSPNCVSSQATDDGHKIAPLTYQTSAAEAMTKLKDVVQQMSGTTLVTATETYLYVEFTIPVMGFVDDVEFYMNDARKVIDVRSASRLGYGDFGVNRRRIEDVREKFNVKN
jgi:uncharacterized protein (DUF1499 family)